MLPVVRRLAETIHMTLVPVRRTVGEENPTYSGGGAQVKAESVDEPRHKSLPQRSAHSRSRQTKTK